MGIKEKKPDGIAIPTCVCRISTRKSKLAQSHQITMQLNSTQMLKKEVRLKFLVEAGRCQCYLNYLNGTYFIECRFDWHIIELGWGSES